MNRSRIGTGVAVLAMCGCYTTAAIPPAQIASIERPLAAPRAIAGVGRLGPRTEIRARLTDGGVTRWLPAGELAVGKDGLVTGRRHGLATVTEVAISGAGDSAAAMLSATAPPGAHVAYDADRLRLRVGDPRLLLPWIAAYAGGAATLHQEAGWFSFRDGGGQWESEPVPASKLAGLTPQALAGMEIAEGIPWSDVAGLELHNMDPLRTTGAVIGMPIAMSLMMLSFVGAAGAIANGDDPTPALALGADVAAVTAAAADSADEGADTGGAPIRASQRPAVLVAPGAPDGQLAATALFSPSARRRDAIKLVLAGEAGATADGTFTAGGGVGFRAGDFIEVTARVRTLAFDDTPDALRVSPATISTVCCGVAGGDWTPPRHPLFGGRLAFHIDPDGDPRTAFVFGAEVLGGPLRNGAELTQLGLLLGPRFGIGDKMFASLLVSPSLLTWSGLPDRADGTAGQVTFTAEIGFDL